MAKIKCEIKEDSILVEFGALQEGEIFLYHDAPFIKANDNHVPNLINGRWTLIDDDEPVTYVKSAELKLTI
jgi:hypothetical protein